MQTSVLGAALLAAFLCTPPADYLHPRVAAADRGALGLTHIEVQDAVLQPAVERVGINLGEQTFFDSGMMLKNLVARNPGFEGGSYRSILHCVHADAARCTDDDADSAWPKDFWRGGTYEWISGPLEGRKGTVTGSTAAVRGDIGAVLQLADAGGVSAKTASAAAYLVVHKNLPGDAMAGWWAQTQGGATLTAETADLSPKTAGRQALRMTAEGAGASASAISYFDTTEGHTFLRLQGHYRLSFRAKAVKGSSAAGKGLSVALERLSTPAVSFVKQNVELSGAWQDLHVDFDAKDAVGAGNLPAAGAVRLMFTAENATVLLDDVSLVRMDGNMDNPTVFRGEVVDALRAYRPGVLRFMQSASAMGSTVDNLLAEPSARVREGYSAWTSEQTDVGYGLPEFLELCVAVKADPWIVVPAGASASEMRRLVGYLGAGKAPWSARFGRIHLELGNEAWNSLYKGASIEEPEAYGHRAAALFKVARQSAGFDAKKFDLIVGGQAGWHERNQQMVTHTDGADTLAVAPYLLHDIPGSAMQDAVFGALLAEPEMFATTGMIAQNMAVAKRASLGLSLYEENLHSTEGSPAQAMIDAVVPSAGAGVAMASEMLQAMRAGVKSQALFSLAGWRFHRTDGTWVPLWGTTVDMGVTNRRRPQFLAGQIINTALGGAMTATVQAGDDPAWDETAGIDGVKVQGAHMLQSFSFKDGKKHAVVLINLSRNAGLTVDFTGAVQPHGRVEMSQLRAGKITDSNENAENVKIVPGVVPDFKAGQKVTVPGFSVMVMRWVE